MLWNMMNLSRARDEIHSAMTIHTGDPADHRDTHHQASPKTIPPVSLYLCVSVLCFFMTACGTQSAPPTADPAPTVMSKLLATVYISPTPNEAELQATRFAARATPTVNMQQPTPTATVYVGVFLGPADDLDDRPVPTRILLERPTDAPASTLDAVLAACPREPDPIFGEQWLADPAATEAIGCPAGDTRIIEGSVQLFERGAMYFNPEGQIWVIQPGASGQFWFVAPIPTVEEDDITAPDGLRVPVFGFGAAWRAIPGVRDALGFARTDETSATFTVLPMQNGTLLRDNNAGQVFVLRGNASSGAALGPYQVADESG